MTITNHLITGAVIAASVKEPWLSVPLAFLSHFVLDALPHFGYGNSHGWSEIFRHKLGRIVVGLDVMAAVYIGFILIPSHGYLLIAALAALSPDFAWPLRYFFYERRGVAPKATVFTSFHNAIQRYERPWGIAVEAPYFAIMLYVLFRLIQPVH